MAIVCGNCQRKLDYSGDPPKFCAYCGVRLDVAGQATATAPDGATLTGSTVAYEGPADTTPEDQADAPAVPSALVGGYRLLRLLGAGGMGTVYEAECGTTGQHVAVKLLSAKFAEQRASLERFRQEGQLASLIAHPRCVFVLAADEEAGRPYIVMELMPGQTLRDLVEQRGPLPPLEAVAKILDVIEGLREAHRLGILHRDVKPSNCFLMPDGRVKVGDFGLSKSLTGDVQLTQTGAFLGTVLYASPEQVRGEDIDYASDVYSVCATLYFLLTGRAPFQHENPGTVLAKVLSEDPPPVRTQRPDVSRRLERVVLTGLERDSADRWPTLDDLESALRALIPGTMTRGSLGLRFAAYLIDTLILFVMYVALVLAARRAPEEILSEYTFVGDWLPLVLDLVYFAVAEGVWGCSVGKFCLRLRVCPLDDTEPPPWPRLLVRTAVFVALAYMLTVADNVLGLPVLVAFLLWVAALAALFGPMRRGNGYRGLHELVSGTRVVQLPWAVYRRSLLPLRERFALKPVPAGRYPEEIGPYRIRGAIYEDEREVVLSAHDPSLGRAVHVWLRPESDPPLSAARRSVSRPTRPRWLGGGEEGAWTWDAFFAPQGAPLADLVAPQRPLGWAEARHTLEQIADELRDARADETLPPTVNLERVWVLPDGRVQLLDFALNPRPEWVPDEAGVLHLLQEAAILALEGAPRPPGAPPYSVRAPVPRHAVELTDRLLGVREPYADSGQFRDELQATRDRPAEATRPTRAVHVGVQAVFLAVGLAWMLAFSGLFGLGDLLFTWYHVEHGETALALLNNPSRMDDRLKPVVRELDRDGQLAERLGRRHKADRAYLDRRLRWANTAERLTFGLIQDAMAGQGQTISPRDFSEAVERADAAATDGRAPSELRNALSFRTVFSEARGFALGLLAFWPVAWVLWALLTRGGLTLRLVGLTLVRSDGRPAAWWQCAVRALIVWLPVLAPLVACVWVKVYAPWLVLTHTGLWWLAVAVLLGEAFLAVLQPRQAWHDRLVGVHIVPL